MVVGMGLRCNGLVILSCSLTETIYTIHSFLKLNLCIQTPIQETQEMKFCT